MKMKARRDEYRMEMKSKKQRKYGKQQRRGKRKDKRNSILDFSIF
jgi:hypothetical protein